MTETSDYNYPLRENATLHELLTERDSLAKVEKFQREQHTPKSFVDVGHGIRMAVQNVVLTISLEKEVEPGDPAAFVFPGEAPLKDLHTRPCLLPLSLMARAWYHRGIQYNPTRFPALILRDQLLGAAVLFFENGRILFTGCANIDFALALQKQTLDDLHKLGIDDFLDPVPILNNMVSAGSAEGRFDTEKMALYYQNYCIPMTDFPALRLTCPENKKRAIIVFESGCLGHTGALTLEDVFYDFQNIMNILLDCSQPNENHF